MTSVPERFDRMPLHRCFDTIPIFFEIFLIDGLSSCEYDVCRHDRSPSLLIDYCRARTRPATLRRLLRRLGGESPKLRYRRNLRQAHLHSYDATVDRQVDARDVAAFVGGQEKNSRGYLFWPSNTPHRRHGFEPVLHRIDVGAELPLENGRVGCAWAHHIRADALAGELTSPSADKGTE